VLPEQRVLVVCTLLVEQFTRCDSSLRTGVATCQRERRRESAFNENKFARATRTQDESAFTANYAAA
jgi:hypothetical protein